MNAYDWIQGVRDGPKFSKYDITQKHADAICALVGAVGTPVWIKIKSALMAQGLTGSVKRIEDLEAALARVLEETE